MKAKADGMTRIKAEDHAAWLCKFILIQDPSGMVDIKVVEWLLAECLLHGAKHEREGKA